MTNQNSNINLEDDLDKPYQPPSYEMWGQVGIQLAQVALVKNVGQVPFNPNEHKNPVTGITMTIVPLAGTNNDKVNERKLIQQSTEWAKIQSSLMACGLKKSIEINNKWAHVVFEPTGETYVKTNQDGSKETKNKSYTKFVAIFDNEQACMNAMNNGRGITVQPVTSASTPLDNGRAVAEQFLAPIVESACSGQKDISVILKTIETNIAGMPPVSKYFTHQSPEVLMLINNFISR